MDQTLGIEISTGCGYHVGGYQLSVPSVGLTDSRLHGKKPLGYIMLAVGVGMIVDAATAYLGKGKLKNIPDIAVKLVSGIRR